MAIATPCQTSGAEFHTYISVDQIRVAVDLPIQLNLNEEDASLLEANLHNVLELVLAPYFKK